MNVVRPLVGGCEETRPRYYGAKTTTNTVSFK